MPAAIHAAEALAALLNGSCAFADDIYRDDIVFTDTRNVFKGKKNYKTIFWSLRFHGKLFFSRLTVRVLRIWQPNENLIRYALQATHDHCISNAVLLSVAVIICTENMQNSQGCALS